MAPGGKVKGSGRDSEIGVGCGWVQLVWPLGVRPDFVGEGGNVFTKNVKHFATSESVQNVMIRSYPSE